MESYKKRKEHSTNGASESFKKPKSDFEGELLSHYFLSEEFKEKFIGAYR